MNWLRLPPHLCFHTADAERLLLPAAGGAAAEPRPATERLLLPLAVLEQCHKRLHSQRDPMERTPYTSQRPQAVSLHHHHLTHLCWCSANVTGFRACIKPVVPGAQGGGYG